MPKSFAEIELILNSYSLINTSFIHKLCQYPRICNLESYDIHSSRFYVNLRRSGYILMWKYSLTFDRRVWRQSSKTPVRYSTIRCTFLLRICRVKSRVAKISTGTFDFFFQHWPTSIAVSFLYFQLAAGQNPLAIVAPAPFPDPGPAPAPWDPLGIFFQPFAKAILTQATAGIQQLQAAANATKQTITSQVQASLNSSEQYASALNVSYQRAQACFVQKETQLAAIANASRKYIRTVYRYAEWLVSATDHEVHTEKQAT